MAKIIGDIQPILEKHNKKYYWVRNESGSIIAILFNEDEVVYGDKGVNYIESKESKLVAYSFNYWSMCDWETESQPKTIYMGQYQYTKYDAVTNHESLLNTLIEKFNDKTFYDASQYWECIKKWTKENGGLCEITPPIPTPEGGGGSVQTDNSICSNTGQFGGGGNPLKDIKLFLYANKVTKGNIKLSKPQVEVGTFATDWRPNPSDYVERHSPAYKEVKGIAIQHNQSQNKKYLEIETADGFAYGVDLWGGDTKKLLEQQQKEIEELKKLVQTLEAKINV